MRDDESKFLSEIGLMISEALWEEPELAKKEKILKKAADKISRRMMKLNPGTPMMAKP